MEGGSASVDIRVESGVLGGLRGQQLVSATDDSMSAACLAWDGLLAVPRARRAHNEPDGDTNKQRAADGLDVCATAGWI